MNSLTAGSYFVGECWAQLGNWRRGKMKSSNVDGADENRQLLSDADKDRRLLVALEEFKIVQKRIEHFDQLALTIKSWSITLSAVAIGFGFVENQTILFLLASLSALIFWYLEASFKVYQTALLNRTKELEPKILDLDRYEGPMISEHFRKVLGFGITFQRIRMMLFYENIHHPHSLILFAGLALYFWTDISSLLSRLNVL